VGDFFNRPALQLSLARQDLFIFVNIAGAYCREGCEVKLADVSTAVLTSTEQVLPVPKPKPA
jgi:hypothetical protein